MFINHSLSNLCPEHTIIHFLLWYFSHCTCSFANTNEIKAYVMRLSFQCLDHPPGLASAQPGFPLCPLGSLWWETDYIISPPYIVAELETPQWVTTVTLLAAGRVSLFSLFWDFGKIPRKRKDYCRAKKCHFLKLRNQWIILTKTVFQSTHSLINHAEARFFQNGKFLLKLWLAIL